MQKQSSGANSMNIQANGNITIGGSINFSGGGNTIIQMGDKIIINGIEYKSPKSKFFRGQSLIQKDNKIYVNGHEFKNGKFKVTVRSFLETLFQ